MDLVLIILDNVPEAVADNALVAGGLVVKVDTARFEIVDVLIEAGVHHKGAVETVLPYENSDAVFGNVRHQLHVIASAEDLHEAGGVAVVEQRDAQGFFLRLLHLPFLHREHDLEQHWKQHERDDDHKYQRAPVADGVDQLLLEYCRNRFHSVKPHRRSG